jgi:hypothetical protein
MAIKKALGSPIKTLTAAYRGRKRLQENRIPATTAFSLPTGLHAHPISNRLDRSGLDWTGLMLT